MQIVQMNPYIDAKSGVVYTEYIAVDIKLLCMQIV